MKSPVLAVRTQATVFLSAFLLFFVQPMMGKVLLPWFGGVPAVWTTCLLFFQGALLLAYLWGHLVVLRLSPRAQARLQLALWVAAGFALALGALAWGTPLVPFARLKPEPSASPILWVVGLLTLAVGLPYFALSTTSPVLQAWHARAANPASAYRLAAVSNSGSMLGLLAYPFVVEPLLGTRAQAWLWAAGFVAFAVLARSAARGAAANEVLPASSSRVPLKAGQLVQWVSLAAAASALLMSFTNHLTQEVAPVPFLWVAPLALYLLSFIACFESERWYTSRRFVTGALVLSVVAATALGRDDELPLLFSVPLYLGLLFCWCMAAHGELVRTKPEAGHLTAFALMVSLGGALGGAAVTLLAPVVFSSFAELHASLSFAMGAVGVALWRDPGSMVHGPREWAWRLGLCGLALVVGVGLATSLAVRRVGDARLSLEREPPQGFDVLVVDAFSSDAVPAHLLTREAFSLYLSHLKEDGVLAVHLSNRSLDLVPVTTRVGEALHLEARLVVSKGDGALGLRARWLLMSRHPEALTTRRLGSVAQPPPATSAGPAWTDDATSVWRAVRW